jgi:DNA helicase HerA-like ATPase
MRLFGRKSQQPKQRRQIALDKNKVRQLRLMSLATIRLSNRRQNIRLSISSRPPSVRLPTKVKYEIPNLPPVRPFSPAYFSPPTVLTRVEPIERNELYIGRIVRLIEGEPWVRTVSSDATIDVSRPARMLIVGSSGSGKTNLCKVLVEEYFDKTKDRHIFILDNENEYALMARKSINYETLAKFGLTPKSYPVRVIAPPYVLRDYKEAVLSISPQIELMNLRIDWKLINTPILQYLTGFTDTKITPYLAPAIENYIAAGKFSHEGLETALDSAEALSPKIKRAMIQRIDILVKEGILGDFDPTAIFAERKINVFLIPAAKLSFEEITLWAVFFSTFVRRLAEVEGIPLFVVLDEAREYARAAHQRKVTKSEIGSIFTKGRKRDIDAVISTNVAEMLSDIVPNVTHSFYLRFRAPSMIAGKRVYPSERVREEVESLPRYHTVFDDSERDITAVVEIRPARSFTPPQRRS